MYFRFGIVDIATQYTYICTLLHIYLFSRVRILGRNWDKSKEFSSLLFTATSANGFYPPTRAKCGLKLAWNVNNVYGDLNSENSQDYVQKPKRNCTFMNSVSALFYRQQSTISALSLYKSCINTPGYPLTAQLLTSLISCSLGSSFTSMWNDNIPPPLQKKFMYLYSFAIPNPYLEMHTVDICTETVKYK